VLGHVGHFDRVAQVGLIRAVLGDRRIVGNARPVMIDLLAAGEFLEHTGQDRLHGVENVVLLDEAHLDVELIELAG